MIGTPVIVKLFSFPTRWYALQVEAASYALWWWHSVYYSVIGKHWELFSNDNKTNEDTVILILDGTILRIFCFFVYHLRIFYDKMNHHIISCLFRIFHMHNLPTQDDNIFYEGKKILNLPSHVDWNKHALKILI